MKTIAVPTLEQLSPDAQEILNGVQKKMGKIPNLYATIGYSAPALKAMFAFEGELGHAHSFSPKEKEAINLIVSQVNSCDYCLAAHTALGQMRGYSLEDTIAIRKVAFADEKLNAVLALAKSISENKGKASQQALDAFFDFGYNEAALVELNALIVIRSFTNYVFANTNVPVDFPQAPSL